MTRRRTKLAKYRVRKYKRKVKPRITNILFKKALEFKIPQLNLEDYLRKDNIIETRVMALLEQKGISGDLMKLYLACYRDLFEIYRKFTSNTRKNELEIAISKWLIRGLDKEIIDLILEELEYKSQGWALTDQFEEYSLMLDYLRVKAFAIISEPITYSDFIEAYIILPIHQIFTIRVPLQAQAIRNISDLITYRPNNIVSYEFNASTSNPLEPYKNFITYQLNISYE
jgi:hypothetical protein